jgi:tetratricopeptide (TPR) repeat protein
MAELRPDIGYFPGGRHQTYRYNLDSLRDYIDFGEKLVCNGRILEGADVLHEATVRYEADAELFLDLGVTYFMALREHQAHRGLWEDPADEEDLADNCIAALEEAIALDSGLTPAYNLLGRIFAIRGRHDEALQLWQTSLAIDRNQPQLREEMDFFQHAVMKERDRELETELSRTRQHHWKIFPPPGKED